MTGLGMSSSVPCSPGGFFEDFFCSDSCPEPLPSLCSFFLARPRMCLRWCQRRGCIARCNGECEMQGRWRAAPALSGPSSTRGTKNFYFYSALSTFTHTGSSEWSSQ